MFCVSLTQDLQYLWEPTRNSVDIPGTFVDKHLDRRLTNDTRGTQNLNCLFRIVSHFKERVGSAMV